MADFKPPIPTCPMCGHLVVAPEDASPRPNEGMPADRLDALLPGSEIEGPLLTLGASDSGEFAPRVEVPESSDSGTLVELRLGSRSSGQVPAYSGRNGHSSTGSRASTDDAAAYSGPTSTINTLLLSYASVATLACAWLAYRSWQTPVARRPSPTAQVAVEEGLETGLREDQSANLKPLTAIDPGLRVTLGKTLRVGDLELTPLEARIDRVRLERRSLVSDEERDGPEEPSLILRLLAKNVSQDHMFAPFDEAFLRLRDRSWPDSLIEIGPTNRLGPFRLPVRSEWNVKGERFDAIRPGETIETTIVSEPVGSVDLSQGPVLWRLRVRSKPETIVDVGFEIAPQTIQRPALPEPQPEPPNEP